MGLTDILNIKYPIICGPMAWTSMAPLVGAVSNAGGLGVLGVGFSPNDVVEQQIKETKKLTDHPFAINVAKLVTSSDENLKRITEIAVENGVKCIYADSLSGLDQQFIKKWFDKWHEMNMTVISKVMSAKEAQASDESGADVIIAKGLEGGGHMSHDGMLDVGTLALVPQVVDVVKHATVVASGGIVDGSGYAAARVLGASGIEMGTAFLAAKEGGFSENVKKAVVEASADNIVMTGYATGAPCWQIKNQLSAKMNQVEQDLALSTAAPKVIKLSSGSLRKASQEGDTVEQGAVMAGQAVTLVKQIQTAANIMADVYENGVSKLRAVAQFKELSE